MHVDDREPEVRLGAVGADDAAHGRDGRRLSHTGGVERFTIVTGHEIEETIAEPGAEDVIDGQNLGAPYDHSRYENADTCAWVGYPEGIAPPSTVPGALANITGNDGKSYAVPSLWSNNSAGGTGWCAGAGDTLPVTG